jgi:hypothetical protein
MEGLTMNHFEITTNTPIEHLTSLKQELEAELVITEIPRQVAEITKRLGHIAFELDSRSIDHEAH